MTRTYVGFANAKLPDTDYRVAFALQTTEYDVFLALPERPASLPSEKYVNINVGAGMSLGSIFEIAKIPRILRGVEADFAHFFATQFVLLGPILARLVGTRSVITITGVGRAFDGHASLRGIATLLLYKCFFRISVALSDAVLFQNSHDLEILSGAVSVKQQRKFQLIGSGVDQSYFPLNAGPPPPATDLPVCLMVARLIPSKGVDDFLQLASRFRDQARFVLIGPASDDHPILHARVDAASTAGLIEYRGERSDEDVRGNYLSAAVFVFPSLSEGLPRVVLEASMSGLPVVAYEIPACLEILPRGYPLSAPGDVGGLSEQLGALLTDPATRRRLGTWARETVVMNYSAASYVSRLNLVLRQLCRDRNSRRRASRSSSLPNQPDPEGTL